MARLTKRDVERLLDTYDTDPRAALRRALGRALDRPDDDWATLVSASGLDAATQRGLVAGDPAAFDELARTLNELRQLPHPP